MRIPIAVGMLCMLVLSAQAVQPTSNASDEIAALLSFLGASGCEFYRNGTWYSDAEAQAHLKKKYEYLRGNGKAETAEQFIARAATRSSVSGEQYQIRCGDETAVNSVEWLEGQLLKLRVRSGSKEKQ